MHTGQRRVRRVAQEAAHALPRGAHADPPGYPVHVGAVILLRPELPHAQPDVVASLIRSSIGVSARYRRGCSSGGLPRSVLQPSQSSLAANFAVMPARRKKITVEPVMYHCHSTTEETRETTSADNSPASRSRRSS